MPGLGRDDEDAAPLRIDEDCSTCRYRVAEAARRPVQTTRVPILPNASPIAVRQTCSAQLVRPGIDLAEPQAVQSIWQDIGPGLIDRELGRFLRWVTRRIHATAACHGDCHCHEPRRSSHISLLATTSKSRCTLGWNCRIV